MPAAGQNIGEFLEDRKQNEIQFVAKPNRAEETRMLCRWGATLKPPRPRNKRSGEEMGPETRMGSYLKGYPSSRGSALLVLRIQSECSFKTRDRVARGVARKRSSTLPGDCSLNERQGVPTSEAHEGALPFGTPSPVSVTPSAPRAQGLLGCKSCWDTRVAGTRVESSYQKGSLLVFKKFSTPTCDGSSSRVPKQDAL